MKNEKGFSLVEVLVSLAVVSLVAVAFLSGVATVSRVLPTADERGTANNLAQTQTEYVKGQPYATSYAPASIPAEFDNYTAAIDVEALQDGNIQKITVTIRHHDRAVTKLESYRVD